MGTNPRILESVRSGLVFDLPVLEYTTGTRINLCPSDPTASISLQPATLLTGSQYPDSRPCQKGISFLDDGIAESEHPYNGNSTGSIRRVIWMFHSSADVRRSIIAAGPTLVPGHIYINLIFGGPAVWLRPRAAGSRGP